MKECFHYFDKDKSGKIDKKEIAIAMQAVGLNPTKKQVERIMKQLDENGE